MPLFAVICRDRPDHLATRLSTRARHLEYIADTGIVAMAGPLLEEGEMRGSLIVLDCADLDAAKDWAAHDPYAQAGLFENVQVVQWNKVIG